MMKFASLFLSVTMLLTACGEARVGVDPRYTGGADIVGIWQTKCEKLTTHSYYSAYRLYFANDYAYRMEMRHYNDSNCQTFVEISNEFFATGDYILGNAVTTSDGLAAREIDIREHLLNHDTNVGYSRVLKTIYYLQNNTLYFAQADYDAPRRPAKLDLTSPYYRR